MANKPDRLNLRSYQVGFGDCYLLSFRYPSGERHVLVDCGSTGKPAGVPAKLLTHVAKDIALRCGNKLHAVVATHRHQDHVNGFATAINGKGPGDVIAACKPDVVIQPWTEDPDAEPDAGKPITALTASEARVRALSDMNRFSESVVHEASRLRAHSGAVGTRLAGQLAFLGEDNIKNLSAVKNLMKMGKRNRYVFFGSKSGLESVLPGVKTGVLGPPTPEQHAEVRKQRDKDDAEFWHFQAASARRHLENASPPFRSPRVLGSVPPSARWFVPRLLGIRADQLLQIVRSLDDAMNNTSVILLFEIGTKSLLFPGDAQIENWEYALSKPAVRQKLAKVNLYKVGHHGSLNATPKSLWKLFANRGTSTHSKLQTLVSTMAGKHGHVDNDSEVPRRKLVNALRAETSYFSTQDLKKTELFRDFEIAL